MLSDFCEILTNGNFVLSFVAGSISEINEGEGRERSTNHEIGGGSHGVKAGCNVSNFILIICK